MSVTVFDDNVAAVVVLQPDNAGGACFDAKHDQGARLLAAKLSLPHVDNLQSVAAGTWVLHYHAIGQTKASGLSLGLALSKKDDPALQNISVDLTADSKRVNSESNLRSELLIKAVGGVAVGASALGRRHIIDATAGLAADSLLLASAGHKVSMIERSPIVAALIDNALVRAEQWHDLMRLYSGDACTVIKDISAEQPPDIIYLDPMFPGKKKNALSRKGIQSLKQLLTEPAVDAQLLDIALQYVKHRVVVKRPLKAPALEGPKPGFAVKGKLVRYDCYAISKL